MATRIGTIANRPARSRGRRELKNAPRVLKKFTENAGAVALMLGLILSVISLYEVAVRKPEADRLAAIAQFNQTVNSAAKTRQELIQSYQAADPEFRLAIASMATPRILNDIATARAILPTLDDKDVGIPQLLILISEAMTAGDNASAEEFIRRAGGKRGVPLLQAAEALRYKGKYQFVIGDRVSARSSYLAAINVLGNTPQTAAARGYVLADLIGMEFAYGDCEPVGNDITELARLTASHGVSAEARVQLVASVTKQIRQFSNQKCPTPKNLPELTLLPNEEIR